MTSVGGYTRLEPGAGVSIDPRLGCPTIKVGAALTGQVGLVEGEVPPGGGFQIPRWHEDLDEAFYVLEGEIEFPLDGRCSGGQAAAASEHKPLGKSGKSCVPFPLLRR